MLHFIYEKQGVDGSFPPPVPFALELFFFIGPFALELWQRLFSQARSCDSYNFGDNVGDEELWTGRIRVKALSLWETQDISLQESPSPICFSFSSHTTSEQK